MDGDGARERIDALRRATAALAELQDSQALCPPGTDRFDWCADALDELARLVCAVAPTLEHLTGRANDVVTSRTDDLATAIVAHRNALMGPGRDGADVA